MNRDLALVGVYTGGNFIFKDILEEEFDIHFKDYKSGAFLPLGEGGQDFKEMITVLRKENYQGWITVELDSSENPLKAAQISKAYLKDRLNIG